MGFSAEVRDKVLIACNRHCCICHKFCGTKMQLHHIQQRADGGDDSFENCIPLCFDCHSEMGKIDPHHPQGRQYSPRELMGHRDSWYQKVKNSSFTTHNTKICDEDKELFNKICGFFNDEIQSYLKEEILCQPFPHDLFYPLDNLIYKNKDPLFTFIDDKLESMKDTMMASVEKFIGCLCMYTFSVQNSNNNATNLWLVNHGWAKFPNKATLAQFEQDEKALAQSSREVWESYCTFVKDCRRIINS